MKLKIEMHLPRMYFNIFIREFVAVLYPKIIPSAARFVNLCTGRQNGPVYAHLYTGSYKVIL
jgi:hypothetical protein